MCMKKIESERQLKKIQFWRMDSLSSYKRSSCTILDFAIKTDKNGRYLKINKKRVYIETETWNFLASNMTKIIDYTRSWNKEYYSIYIYPQKYNDNEYPLYIIRSDKYFLNKECLIERNYDKILSSKEHQIQNLDDAKKEIQYIVDELDKINKDARRSAILYTSKLEYRMNIYLTIIVTILGIVCSILLAYGVNFYSILFGEVIIIIASIYGVFAYLNSISKIFLSRKFGSKKHVI